MKFYAVCFLVSFKRIIRNSLTVLMGKQITDGGAVT